MPKNLRGGKHKHIKRGSRYTKDETLTLASDQPGCMYAMIQKRFGTAFDVLCSNGKIERALMRGKLRNRVWINPGDIVLVDGTELNKFYIVLKYTPDQTKQLKSKGEITFDVRGDRDEGIIFEGEGDICSDEENELFKELDIAKNDKIVDNLEYKPQSQVEIKNEDVLEPNKNKHIEKDNGVNDSSNDEGSDLSSNEEEDEEGNKNKQRNDHEVNLVNKDKLMKHFRNKARGGKGVVRERGRSAARDKKNKNKINVD